MQAMLLYPCCSRVIRPLLCMLHFQCLLWPSTVWVYCFLSDFCYYMGVWGDLGLLTYTFTVFLVIFVPLEPFFPCFVWLHCMTVLSWPSGSVLRGDGTFDDIYIYYYYSNKSFERKESRSLMEIIPFKKVGATSASLSDTSAAQETTGKSSTCATPRVQHMLKTYLLFLVLLTCHLVMLTWHHPFLMELFPLMSVTPSTQSFWLSSNNVSQFGLLTFVEVLEIGQVCFNLEMGYCVSLLMIIFALLYPTQTLALCKLFCLICTPLV